MKLNILIFLLSIVTPYSHAQEFLQGGAGYAGIGVVGDVKKSNVYGDIKREVHPVTQIGLQEYKFTKKKEFTAQTIVSMQTNKFQFAGFDNYGSGMFFFENKKLLKVYLGAGLRGAIHISPNPNAISTDPYADSSVLSATSQSAAQIEIGYRDFDPKRIRMVAPVFGIKSTQGERSKYQLGARTRLSMNENILNAEAIYSKRFDVGGDHDFTAYLSALMNMNKVLKKVKLPVDVYAGLDARISAAYLKTQTNDEVRTTKSHAGVRLMVTFK